MMKSRVLSRIVALLTGIVLIASLCACGEGGDATKDEDGALTKISSDGGNVIGYERKYHNDRGDITRLDVYDKDENYDHYVIYEYDDAHRLVKETTYRADGIGDYYYTYEYDENGVLTEKGYFTQMNGATRTLYDAKGYATEKFTYDSDSKLVKHEVNKNGKWEDAPLEDADKSATEEAKQETKAE